MHVPRANQTETVLASGRVLVAGGGDRPSGFTPSAEVYDPTTNTWSTTGSMADARGFATATSLPNGRVLLAGGFGNLGDLASAEEFDPQTGSFARVGSMGTPRAMAAAAPLPGGRVLIAGGQRYTGAFLRSSEIFEPSLVARLGLSGLAVTPTRVTGQRHLTLTYGSPGAGRSVIRIERARPGGRFVRLAQRLVHTDTTGRNRVVITLPAGSRRLVKGSYRLVVVQTGSPAVTVAFTVAA
jgi:hypothetical protein